MNFKINIEGKNIILTWKKKGENQSFVQSYGRQLQVVTWWCLVCPGSCLASNFQSEELSTQELLLHKIV